VFPSTPGPSRLERGWRPGRPSAGGKTEEEKRLRKGKIVGVEINYDLQLPADYFFFLLKTDITQYSTS
jgi:hypothetical protein